MVNLVPNPNFNSNPGKPFNGVNGIELLDPNDALKKTAIPGWTVSGQTIAWMAPGNSRGIDSPGKDVHIAFVDLTGGNQAGSPTSDGGRIYGAVGSDSFATNRGRRHRVTLLVGTYESDEPGQLPRGAAGPCSVRVIVGDRGDDPSARIVHPPGGQGTQWIQGSVDFRATADTTTLVLRGELTAQMVSQRGVAGSDFIGVTNVTVEELPLTLWDKLTFWDKFYDLVHGLTGDIRRIILGRR